MKRVETALEVADFKNFEKVCLEQDISMRKKTKQLILSFLGSIKPFVVLKKPKSAVAKKEI